MLLTVREELKSKSPILTHESMSFFLSAFSPSLLRPPPRRKKCQPFPKMEFILDQKRFSSPSISVHLLVRPLSLLCDNLGAPLTVLLFPGAVAISHLIPGGVPIVKSVSEWPNAPQDTKSDLSSYRTSSIYLGLLLQKCSTSFSKIM